MPRANKLTMPSTGLNYTSSQVCVYRKGPLSLRIETKLIILGIRKTPSVLCISPEGTLRHWSSIDKPHKDHQLEFNNEVAHSLVVFDEQSKLLRALRNL